MARETGVVGIIGLGQMGGRMARVLRKAGWRVVAWDVYAPAVETARKDGIETAVDAAAVADAAPIVITSLPDIKALNAVVYGDRGLVATKRKDLLLVDTSTLTPDQARVLAKDLAGKGIDFLDAPLSGGIAGAEKGTLGIMIGGDRKLFDRAKPILDVLGSKVVLCGPLGAGQIVKACTQLIVVSTLGAVAEAMTIAKAAGVDPAVARDVMLAGYATSPILDAGGGRMISRDFNPGGKAAYNVKDIIALAELSEAGGVPIPVFDAAAGYIKALMDAGGGDLDHAAIITIIEKNSRPPKGAKK
jgi:2-hydroxy-3-oxopropionate reductase